MPEYKVVDTQALDTALSATANAIRAKSGSSSQVTWDSQTGFMNAVNEIQADSGDNTLAKFVDGTIESYSLPEGTTSIRHGLFYECTALTNVYIPNTVQTIFSSAFYNCKNLILNELPDSIININSNAFYNSYADASKISLSRLPSNLKTLGSGSFRNSSVTINTVPSGVTSLSASVFSNCNNIMEFTIPSTVKIVYSQAFNNCSSLSSVTFEGTPSSINNNVFQNCTALTTINVPWVEGAVANAPWGATNATINYNYTGGG